MKVKGELTKEIVEKGFKEPVGDMYPEDDDGRQEHVRQHRPQIHLSLFCSRHH